MTEQQTSPAAAIWSMAMVGLAAISTIVLVLLGGVSGGVGTVTRAGLAGNAGTLNVEAIPEHARHLAWTVVRAGSICPEVTPPLIAAQIEQESNWNADAVAHNPASRGGDAMGIAQFQQATWDEWGQDGNGNGVASPWEPEDAILSQGTLMCAHVQWANQQLAAGRLTGDPVDLALAAYFCGRGCVSDAGGVPSAGLAAAYPGEVRDRVPKYTLAGIVPTGEWVLPLAPGSYQFTSGFGPRWGRLHAGIDLAAPTGTPIYAAAAGVVLDAGCTSPRCDIPGSPQMSGCGWRVNLSHGDGIVTRYCHAVALAVSAGEQVAAGQVIGWVGSTGNSTGSHLHFETHRGAPPATNDTAVDPVPFLQAAGVQV